MQYFGDVASFLCENELAPANRRKIPAILDDPQKRSCLQVELAVVIDVGEQFVKATYSLEGDGPLVFSCFEVLSNVDASIRNTVAIIEQISGLAGSIISSQQWLAYARESVEPGRNYFKKKFTDKLSGTVAALKATWLFLPDKVDEMKPDVSVIDTLKAFPVLDNITVLNELKQELPTYLAKAAECGLGHMQ